MILKIVIYFILINLFLAIRNSKNNYLYCGIFGFISTNNNFDVNKAKILFLYNYARGSDSCGFYTPTSGVVKKKGKVLDNLPEFIIPEDNVIVGHTRQATVGVVNDSNAHPFEYKDIICVHNGFIKNWKENLEQLGISTVGISVDSEAFAKLVGEVGINKAIESLPGSAIATIIYNKVEKQLYIYRNKERPLYRGNLDKGTYISSTEDSLKAIGCTKIKEFKENYLYTIKNENIESSIKVTAKEKPIVPSNKILHWGKCVNEFNKNLTLNKWYRIIEQRNDSWFSVVNDTGSVSEHSDYVLKGVRRFNKGEMIVAMEEMCYPKDKTIAKPGDKFKFIDYQFDDGEKKWKIVWEHPELDMNFVSDLGKFRVDLKEPTVKPGNVVRLDSDDDIFYEITKVTNDAKNPIQLYKLGTTNPSYKWAEEKELDVFFDTVAEYNDWMKMPASKIPPIEPDLDDDILSIFSKMDDEIYSLTPPIDSAYAAGRAITNEEYSKFYEKISTLVSTIEELKESLVEQQVSLEEELKN